MPAVYPQDVTPLPILYDSPACSSVSSPSLLACPRLPALCLGGGNSAAPDAESGSGSGSSPEHNNILGRLTSEGQVGIKALNGVVGVRCEGNIYYFHLQYRVTSDLCRVRSVWLSRSRYKAHISGEKQCCWEFGDLLRRSLEHNVLRPV